MNRKKHIKKSQRITHNVMYWVVGILLVLTMLSLWLVSGLFAKYTVSDNSSDSARVANGGYVELWEHEAELKNGIYVLKQGENGKTANNTYNTVIPGVDIAKDPFVRINLEDAEVDYELYLQVTEKDLPTYKPTAESSPVKTVTYELTDKWELIDEAKGIYKYKGIFESGMLYDNIKILNDDKLYVSEHYVGKDSDGNDKEFTITFNAWIKQAD